jgi:hypothetical protein
MVIMVILIFLTDIMAIIHIMILVYIQLDFKPADIKHSSLHTMAKHVRRAMLPDNHEVFQKLSRKVLGSVEIYDIFTYMMLTLFGRVGWKAGP